ncbi:MAG: pyridoxal-phosphate dependent enzyme, partial [Hymenobacter sp.]|nr:pyridoxal-phosphate dependent enzyme [Hymenobacter sp.]
LTTLGQNITALEVRGNFDDCQRLVKQAFLDARVTGHRQLTSANSINVARWLPQQFYYCYALQQWPHATPPVVAVPSGNFGNLCAGLLAHASGLPVAHFVAACNANSAVADYLRTGTYAARPAVVTLSNAMDVGSPSNFGRILELFGQRHADLSRLVSGAVVSDAETTATIGRVHEQTGYLLDPHGAVALRALEEYLREHPAGRGIFLETAHPVKFPEVVEPVIGAAVPVPAAVRGLLNRTKQSVLLEPEYAALQEFLLR